MTILVTGARGFIGRHLCATLAADGVPVAAIGRRPWSPAVARAAGVAFWHEGEIDHDGLTRLAAAASPIECVYHLAGGSSVGPSLAAPLTDFRNSVDTTARLLEWLRIMAPDAGVVVASSAAVYGAAPHAPIAESAAIAPLSPYGVHKAIVEQLTASYAASFGLRGAVVRLFSVYGPGLTKQLLWDVCGRCAAGPAVAVGGTGSEQRDWLHVDDAVALLRCAAGQVAAAPPFVNGGTGRGTSVRTAVDLVCAAWGDGRHAVFDGRDRAGNPLSLVAAIDRAQAMGFAATTSLAEGIASYVRWYRAR